MARPTFIEDLAREMFLVAGRYEKKVQAWETDLFRIFESAEANLYRRRAGWLAYLGVTDGGTLDGSPEALARIERLRADIRQAIDGDLVEPGKAWADTSIPGAFGSGRDLARMNLSHDMISRDVVRQAFLNIRPAERGVLEVGIRDTYRIMGTVGDDIAEFMRSTMTEASILGLPIQGPGDTLENRLFESGRLKPTKIRTKDGKIITRTVRQRAVAIARVETAKVYNRVHELKVDEVLGDEAVFANGNPEDHRTTDICREASAQPPMTMAEWDASKWGRPPRLEPQFHLCRSFLIAGTREMFSRTRHPSAEHAIDAALKDVGALGPGDTPAERKGTK